MKLEPTTFTIDGDQIGTTLAACLRRHLPGESWTRIRTLIASRRVKIGDVLCVDPARRLKDGDTVQLSTASERVAPTRDALVIRHLDSHLVVVEKPSGIATVRHPVEREWSAHRKALHPTLEDLLPPLIAVTEGKPVKRPLPRLRVVQRLDKDTSGLVVFARTVTAERGLGQQFKRHTVIRRYLAVVPGEPVDQRIFSRLVRDRADGRRGSTTLPGVGKEAITHVEAVERLGAFTLLSCRLETGRTHQIRIHLAELGHPICGEKVYILQPNRPIFQDRSRAPRLALHATELGFTHPSSGRDFHWSMPLPTDLEAFVTRLRGLNEKKS